MSVDHRVIDHCWLEEGICRRSDLGVIEEEMLAYIGCWEDNE